MHRSLGRHVRTNVAQPSATAVTDPGERHLPGWSCHGDNLPVTEVQRVTRVVVAEDDVLMREGLASLLERGGYEVVDPPGAGGDQAATTTQPPPSDDLYIYPQSGQSDEQQANDKYECHKWASSQSGFDPTQSAGGVSPDQAAAKRADYDRAMRACLEGRGYSVR